MNTELTELKGTNPRGWVLYDAQCPWCIRFARRFSPLLATRGFVTAPLQTGWALEKLGLPADARPDEMRLLLANGEAPGGADAIIAVSRAFWWMRPLDWLARLPGAMPILRAIYRRIAAARPCADGACSTQVVACSPARRQPRTSRLANTRFEFAAACVLPLFAMLLRNVMASWVFMWVMAASIFYSCKWLTWRRASRGMARPSPHRPFGYFFAWPGMDATPFLAREHKAPSSPTMAQWVFASTKVLFGAFLVWIAARHICGEYPLLAGWCGMVGLVIALHFGLFELLALAWQRGGVPVRPVMQGPLRASSLADFWGGRWNAAFNTLAHLLAFRPLARRMGITWATVIVFFISGLVHELVISLPARAGYGLPTAYFLLQAGGVLLERSAWGKRSGLGHGLRGWLFVVLLAGVPAWWLFHPPFVENVILPMLQAIGVS